MNSTQNAAQMFAVHTETGREIPLVMQELTLAGHILPVGARVVVRHVFRSAETQPVEAIYAFGLPRDAAFRQFRIEGKDFTVVSDLKKMEEAVKLYESGIQEGKLSALARQYGDGLVNLSIGNLRPEEEVSVFLEVLAGVEVRDEGYRFRFPFSLAPAYHPDARVGEAESGVGEIELPEDRFGDILLPRFREDAEGLHRIGFEITVHQPDHLGEVSSPSHTIRVRPEGQDIVRVSLAQEKDLPNRDLVLDVKHATRKPLVFAARDARGRGQLAALLPSSCFGAPAYNPARVALVLDRSASMAGAPIEQAKKAIEACLAALSANDMFGIVAFDNQSEQFMPALTPADKDNRDLARNFLKKFGARGGTELLQALRTAGSLFEEPGGDLLVVTDGQVFETETILKAAREMGHRLHVLGIGSASQDRFLSLLARETGGMSRFLTPKERVDLGALELFSAIGRPAAEGITIRSDKGQKVELAPDPPSAVFAGSPLLLWGETSGPGAGQMELTWGGEPPNSLIVEYDIPDVTQPLAETLRLLRGARLLTDLDSKLATCFGPEEKRQTRRIEERIQRLSEEFRLSSRRMALVAVFEREGDRTGTLPTTRIVSVGVPEDVAFDSYFGTLGDADFASFASVQAFPGMKTRRTLAVSSESLESVPAKLKFPRLHELLSLSRPRRRESAQEVPVGDMDFLVKLAALIEPDGGMPGHTLAERVQRSLLALLCFHVEENTRLRSVFKRHSERLSRFIRDLDRDVLPGTVQSQMDLTLQILEEPDFRWGGWAEAAKKLAMEQPIEEDELERLFILLSSI